MNCSPMEFVDDHVLEKLMSLVSGVGIRTDGSQKTAQGDKEKATFNRTIKSLRVLQTYLPAVVFVTLGRANNGVSAR